MKTPVCEVCAKTGELCSGCNDGIKKGRITELDAKISHMLYEINERHNISQASFVRALDLETTVLMLTDGEPGLLIGKGGKVVSEIASRLGRRVRIAQYKGDAKRTIEDLIVPVRMMGMNKVFHGGVEATKIRLQRKSMHSLPMDLRTFEKAASTLLNMQVTVVFED